MLFIELNNLCDLSHREAKSSTFGKSRWVDIIGSALFPVTPRRVLPFSQTVTQPKAINKPYICLGDDFLTMVVSGRNTLKEF